MLTETLEPPTMVPPMITPPMVEKPKQFDWLTTLQELASGRFYSREEHDNLKWRASNWPTCACGQLCKALPRKSPKGRPIDDILFAYGSNFYNAVKLESWVTALYLFNRIEYRTNHLLNEQRIILDSLQSRW